MESVTAVITTSPIGDHPTTAFIDAVYGSIRHHLPDCPILILADGVREEQQHLSSGYAEYKERLKQKNWHNVTVREFASYHHQAGMIRAALADNDIETPLLFWVEHDFPMNYVAVDWTGIQNTLLSGEASCIRFCHDDDTRYFNRVHQQEQYRTLTGECMEFFTNRHGLPLLPVIGMDTLPHVATVEFYRFLVKHFQEGKIHVDCPQIQEVIEHSFPQHKLFLYTPEGNLRRFENLMGRRSEPKYPMVF